LLEPPAALQLVFVRSVVPPRPRGVAPAEPGGTRDAPVPPPETPVISPQLTAEEQSSAQRQTEQSLRAAEQILQSTLGRKLSGTQAELAERVRSFISQAREATHAGDVLRARNLAQKAELLSLDLAKSL
jgi:hypothetical protein